MSDEKDFLKDILLKIRQHPALNLLLEQISKPEVPRFSMGAYDRFGSLESFGVRTAYMAGRRDQHNAWLTLLTGEVKKETD